MTGRLGTVLGGGRPVRAVVTVKSLDIPSAIRRVLVADGNRFQADVALVGDKTGAELVAYRDQAAFVYKSGGLAASSSRPPSIPP